MPSFTAQLPDLQGTGPLVEMRVWIPGPMEEALKSSGSALPVAVPVKGMIDTGAVASVIQPAVAKQLGLHPVGVTNIGTASSASVACDRYAVRLIFPHNVMAEVTAIEAPLEGQGIQCLVGRDVLAHAVLVYTGYMNQFTLSF